MHQNLGLTSRAASTLLHQQDSTLEQSRERLKFLEALGQGATGLRDQLVALQNVLQPWKSERFQTARTSVARYTMASERLVQKSLDDPGASSAGNSSAADGDMEMFDNLDLFEADPTAFLPAIQSPSAAQASADDNIDFF